MNNEGIKHAFRCRKTQVVIKTKQGTDITKQYYLYLFSPFSIIFILLKSTVIYSCSYCWVFDIQYFRALTPRHLCHLSPLHSSP